ncbi:glycine/sarcosine/betaine reductase complex component C subunit beta [Chloroflexota bacterium]
MKGVSYLLAHVPSMVRYGSKPSREIGKDPSLLPAILSHLSTYDKAVAYPPNQVFIGNLDPDDLLNIPTPWYQHPVPDASRWGAFGEIMPEDEFLAMVKVSDEFDMLLLEESFVKKVATKFKKHPLFNANDLGKIGEGVPLTQVQEKIGKADSIPIYVDGNRLVGLFRRPKGEGAEEDSNLTPAILLENLTVRASGALALRHLINKTGDPEKIDYLLGCGEEAVGDRYNRGGGNMAKAIGQLGGCNRATGCDVKAFCCAPLHAIVLAAGLVSSRVYHDVIVVGGGSLAKLGMKFQGHLRKDIPILEDVLAAAAVWIGQDDGKSPLIRLDSIGRQEIGSGSSQQDIMQNLVVDPLDRLGLKLTDVDKYATEMHNPEVTEPQGSGNVPRTNYRTIGSFAVMRGEIAREDLDGFVTVHGMPGFAPTQGHIPSALPVIGHSLRKMREGKMKNTMFLAKGSLFLGRVTQLSDGISFILERNGGGN